MTVMIEVNKLRKEFGSFVALSDVTFSIKRGEVLGFLGPNGAGKSTAMKMITGFLTPTEGTIKVCGFDVAENPIEVKSNIGYLPEGAPAYGDMTPKSFLEFIADIRSLKGVQKQQAIENAIDKTNLKSVLHKPIETLSKGFKRRVGLAQAILHNPDVLILDEPTDGLDPNQKHEVRKLLKDMAKDKAIIISTHILEEVGAVCTRAIIISQGKRLFDGTPIELEALSPVKNAISMSISSSEASTIITKLKALSGVKTVNTQQTGETTTLLIIPDAGQSIIKEVAQLSRSENWVTDEMHVEPVKLDDVFRQVTTQSDEIAKEVLT